MHSLAWKILIFEFRGLTVLNPFLKKIYEPLWVQHNNAFVLYLCCLFETMIQWLCQLFLVKLHKNCLRKSPPPPTSLQVINFRDNNTNYHLNGHFVHPCKSEVSTKLVISHSHSICWNFKHFSGYLGKMSQRFGERWIALRFSAANDFIFTHHWLSLVSFQCVANLIYNHSLYILFVIDHPTIKASRSRLNPVFSQSGQSYLFAEEAVDNLNLYHDQWTASHQEVTQPITADAVIVMSSFVVTVKGWCAPSSQGSWDIWVVSFQAWMGTLCCCCCSADHYTHLSSHVLGAMGAETLQRPPVLHTHNS